jgi:hypothetical protein
VLLDRQGLRKAVGGHFGSGYPFELDAVGLDLLSELMTMDIDVFKLSDELWSVLLKKSDGLLIIT